MAKVKLYKVKKTNGYGPSFETVPAHSKHNAAEYFSNEDIKANAECIGYFDVDIVYTSSVEFIVNDVHYSSGQLGYNYLYSHERKRVDEFLDDLKEKGIVSPY